MKRSKLPTKKWNVLVYLAGDNNLAEEMVWSLQEMKKAASAGKVANAVNVATLFDPRGDDPRRYDIVTAVRRPEGSSDGELESFAPAKPFRRGKGPDNVRSSLARFLGWGVERLSPAGRVAIVLSGHGSGAVGDFLPDEDPVSSLSIPVLGSVLRKTTALRGSKVDILGMDSCQMSSIEVAFEVEDSVHYLIASEGLVLNAGWPYHRVLEALAQSPRSTAEAARDVALRYLAFYRDYELVGLSTDIAVTDLSKIEAVGDGVGELARVLREPLERLAPDGFEEAIELDELRRVDPDPEADFARSVRDVVVLAHQSAQSYKCDRYVDLRDFVEQLIRFGRGFHEDPRTKPIADAAKRLRHAIDEAIVVSGTTGAEFQHSRGLSIYFPWSSREYFREYRRLRFSERTKWADFLEAYLKVTVRMRRYQADSLTKAKSGKEAARDRKGRLVAPVEPQHPPEASLVWGKDVDAGTHRDVDAGTHRDVDAGTHRDVDAGTHRGKTCRSTMRNPPEGFYDGPADATAAE